MAIDVVLKLSEADAEKLNEAFLAGKLADLGITDVAVVRPSPDGKSWVETELKREGKPPGKDGPAR